MPAIQGKILKIAVVDDKKAYIIMRKKDGHQFIMVAYEVYGYYKELTIDQMKMQPGDRISANMVLRSREHNGHWYTSASLRLPIDILERAPKKINDLFGSSDMEVDMDTGEVYEPE